jgi:hypothetical protein
LTPDPKKNNASQIENLKRCTNSIEESNKEEALTFIEIVANANLLANSKKTDACMLRMANVAIL